jgi:flagellar biosynthesis protein
VNPKPKKVQKKKIRKHIDELDSPEKSKLRAIALKYDVDKDKAPKITAMGKGTIAEKILTVAEEYNIPFYEDTNLTELLSKLELDSEIPNELFTLVAEVLAFVYQLEKMSKKRKKVQKKYTKKPKR